MSFDKQSERKNCAILVNFFQINQQFHKRRFRLYTLNLILILKWNNFEGL